VDFGERKKTFFTYIHRYPPIFTYIHRYRRGFFLAGFGFFLGWLEGCSRFRFCAAGLVGWKKPPHDREGTALAAAERSIQSLMGAKALHEDILTLLSGNASMK
jgi:hypothetical protein